MSTNLKNDYFTSSTKPYTVLPSDLDTMINYSNARGTELRPVNKGGTGIGTYAIGDILSPSAAEVISRIAAVANGSYLKSNGVATLPSWSTLNQAAVAGLTTTDDVIFKTVTSTTTMTVGTTLLADTITESSSNVGVTLEGVHLENGVIDVGTWSANVIVKAKLATDITSVGTLSAGDVRARDSIGLVASKASGDLFYWTTAMQRLAKGSDGQVLKLASGVPTWAVDNNTQLSTENVQDIAGPLVATGGTKTNIAITYQDATGDMDFIVTQRAITDSISTTSSSISGSATAVKSAYDTGNHSHSYKTYGNYNEIIAFSAGFSSTSVIGTQTITHVNNVNAVRAIRKTGTQTFRITNESSVTMTFNLDISINGSSFANVANEAIASLTFADISDTTNRTGTAGNNVRYKISSDEPAENYKQISVTNGTYRDVILLN